MKKLITFFLVLFSLKGFCQADFTVSSIINKDLTYTFGNGGRLIRISSDSTLFWRDLSGSKEANEKTKTLHIDEHTLMTSWYNSDKVFVTMLSDFSKLKVTGMVCWPDGKFYPIEGKIQINYK